MQRGRGRRMSSKGVLPRGYLALLDFDYSFLNKWDDLTIHMTREHPCFMCDAYTDRFNATLGGYECSECAETGGNDD